jgi:hypothetical protein
MMKMLSAGGIPPLTDEIRTADEDNPRGYFELEAVKRTDKDASWLDGAEGKAVKVISQLLGDLPTDRKYKVIFMRRKLEEILASQKKMLKHREEDSTAGDDELMTTFAGHVAEIEIWLRDNDHVEPLFVSYNRVMDDPRKQAERIAGFLRGPLDLDAMTSVVEPDLYRNRT